MGPLHGFTSHFKPQFSIFFRHPSPMSPTLSGLPDIAPKAQRPLSRRAPGAIGTPVLVESCFSEKVLEVDGMVWIHRRYTDEHWKVGSANVILSSCFCVVMVTVHICPPLPSGSSRGTKARKLRITNNHNGTYQNTRWQKVSCKNRLNIPKWPKCYITSMEKSTT